MRRAWLILTIAAALGGCTTTPVAQRPQAQGVCPSGQEPMRMAQLFFGRNVGDQPAVSDADFRKFVDEELTPRFPNGLTVLDGGGQWRGPENQLVREASKVVLIVMSRQAEYSRKVEAVRTAYKTRFRQDSVLLLTQDTCVSF
jgi:hypothetical protein